MERDSLTTLLHQEKERFQDISGKIRWTVADTECLDDLTHGRELFKDVERRIIRAGGAKVLFQTIPALLAYKAWQRTKVVYSFNREFLYEMSQTADTKLYTSLLERLPFRDMLFYFPKGTFPVYQNEDVAGMYVHVEKHPESLWVAVNYITRANERGEKFYPDCNIRFPIADNTSISQVFETPQFQEWVARSKQMMVFNHNLTENAVEESLTVQKKALNTAIHLMYYLASKDADIKPIKKAKKPNKTSAKTKILDIPASVIHEVGGKFEEIVYRRLRENNANIENDEKESDEAVANRTINQVKKKRPHVRRAHWQHYHTGKGRTNVEVRWKLDLFVGAKQDNQPIVVYEKDSSKGKRNPNTSKKKQKRNH